MKREELNTPKMLRRVRLDLNTPAELAIFKAMQEVEKAGADVRLTEATMLLAKAKDCVADFIDGVEQSIPPAEGAKKVQWSGYGELGNISQKPLQPTAEGAEEILASLVESLGEPDNSVTDHSYEIRPLTVEGKREWWMFHNGVGSGEPLAQWLSKFATLHARKMARENLREELIDFGHAMFPDESLQSIKHYVDTHLKSKEQ